MGLQLDPVDESLLGVMGGKEPKAQRCFLQGIIVKIASGCATVQTILPENQRSDYYADVDFPPKVTVTLPSTSIPILTLINLEAVDGPEPKFEFVSIVPEATYPLVTPITAENVVSVKTELVYPREGEPGWKEYAWSPILGKINARDHLNVDVGRRFTCIVLLTPKRVLKHLPSPWTLKKESLVPMENSKSTIIEQEQAPIAHSIKETENSVKADDSTKKSIFETPPSSPEMKIGESNSKNAMCIANLTTQSVSLRHVAFEEGISKKNVGGVSGAPRNIGLGKESLGDQKPAVEEHKDEHISLELLMQSVSRAFSDPRIRGSLFRVDALRAMELVDAMKDGWSNGSIDFNNRRTVMSNAPI